MTFLLLLACVVVGATGGYVLATRGSQPTDLSKLPDPPGFYDATSLAVGSDSACAIVAGGRVECWGADSGGLLGTGGSSAAGCDGGCTSAAQAVASVTGAVSVAVGDEFACVLLRTGRVDCWGANNYGQLGLDELRGPQTCLGGGGSVACSHKPMPVPGLRDVVSLAAGPVDACAVTKSGAVYCWGVATDGALGDSSASGSSTSCSAASGPAACSDVPVAVFGVGDATSVAVGSLSACALVKGGRVVCWGNDASAQLGDGTSSGPQICDDEGASDPCSLVPVLVHGLTGAVGVTVGTVDACALRRRGVVDCWGGNAAGALGDGSMHAAAGCGLQATACADTPVRVALHARALEVSAGDGNACAILVGRVVDCWGDDATGQLGATDLGSLRTCVGSGQSGDQPCAVTPVPVYKLANVNALAVGPGTTCALTAGGGSCWGMNTTGQLGNGGNIGPQQCTPAPNAGPCSERPVAVNGLT